MVEQDLEKDVDDLKEEEKAKLVAAEQVDTGASAPTRQREGDKDNWIAGVVLIVIGAFFLLSNLTDFHLNNWWALFIMIPALGSFGSAWRAYQRQGAFTEAARGPFIGGLILSFIASVFLFNLNWGTIWPVFLIIGGLSALMSGMFGR